MSQSSLRTLLPLIQTRWRQGRRMFDSRLLNERRLIIVAVVAFAWFMLDSALVTPAFQKFNAASKRSKAAVMARDALVSETQRRNQDMALKEAEAMQEVTRIRERIERSKQQLAQQQSMLIPARDMRNLLEGMLAQNGRLQLTTMRTLPPEEVKFTPMAGVALSQALLYKQSMEVAVSGSFIEVLTWLRSVESLPRKLLWDGLTLKTDDSGLVTLIMQVHTFSPDRDALEISP
jgi:MSHA biogenesis protein MshJ